MADVGFFDSGKTTGKNEEVSLISELPTFTLEDTYSHLLRVAQDRGIALRDMTPQVAADQITTDEIGKM
jgi:hypothetical protein